MKLVRYIPLILLIIYSGCGTADVYDKTVSFEKLLNEFNNYGSENVMIAAHRALHTKYPENSLAAIRQAIDSEVDIIEIDVRETKDGILLLMHDSNIDRTTSGKGDVSEYTLNELKKFHLKNTPHESDIHRIPTLKEALMIARDKIMVDVDIKGASVKRLVTVVKETGTEDQVIFFDSEYPVLDSLMIMDPELLIMPRARSSEDVDYIIRRYSPKIIHIDDSFYNNDVVLKIKNSGARVWINALGSPDSIALSGDLDSAYSFLMNGGANVIQTDLPITLNYFLTESRAGIIY